MMTSEKKTAANRRNCQKSTGPRTASGKAHASGNALKHGVLSDRLFLDDESPEEFQLLLAGFQASLSPVGSLELMLVEKLAISVWRQRRLIRAESASIELGRRLDAQSNRRQVERALGMTFPQQLAEDALRPAHPDDAAAIDYCRDLYGQFIGVWDALSAGDVERLAEDGPLLFGALKRDADVKGMGIKDFLQLYDGGLFAWAKQTSLKCAAEISAHARRHVILEVAALVKVQQSAPIQQELIGRYQTALDNELYRAIRALREAQEWRLNTLDVVAGIPNPKPAMQA